MNISFNLASSAAIKKYILRLLMRREYSRVELLQRLTAKGFLRDEVEAVLDGLAEKDWQSDARFAELYVRSQAARGYGPIKIKIELKERGVADGLIAEFLDENDVIWYELAKKVYNKKFSAKKAKSDGLEEQLKQKRFLQQRGFTYEQIKSCFS